MCTGRLRSKYIEVGDIQAQIDVPLVAFLARESLELPDQA